MSEFNWVGDNRDMSPDRHQAYRLDNVGLQIGLPGLPVEVLGMAMNWSGMHDMTGMTVNMGGRSPRSSSNSIKNGDVQETIDGITIRKVYVTNIHIEVHKLEIHKIFGCYGRIVNVFVGVSKNDHNKQFAFVTYADPKDAARVLQRHKLPDSKGRNMFVMAADSWHQPKEGPDGQIIWNTSRRRDEPKQEEASEDEDDQAVGAVGGQLQAVEISDEEGLNMLNDDCLLHIFSFMTFKQLSGLERVCKRWQALSYRMWKCLHELSFKEPPFSTMAANTPVLEHYLKRCGHSLTTLDLTANGQKFNETTIAVVAKYCPNLEVLRASSISMANRSLAHLGRCCPKLKQLVLDGCAKFNDNDMMSLLPKCQELTDLHLSHCNNVNGKCLSSIRSPITSLKLCNCPSLEAHHLIMGLEKMSESLKSLTLSACGNLRSSEVSRIVTAVPNLTYLSLSRCFPQYDVKSLSPVGQLTKLTTLNLNLNSAVNDTVLAAIVEGCDALTNINLSGSGGGCAGELSHRGLSMLAKLRKLEELDLSYLEAANNTVLASLTTGKAPLKQLVCRGCPDITDVGTTQVVAMCNDLNLFDLSGCDNVGDATITAALTSVKMRTNNVPLRLIVGGTCVHSIVSDWEVPLLTVDLTDLSEEHLRPDFIDDMFFPPTDSEEEEDLDHLCERIAFMFDDVWHDLYGNGSDVSYDEDLGDEFNYYNF